MTCRDEDEAAAAMNSDGRQNQAPQRYQPQHIPSIRELHPATVRAIADAALRLFEALEAESSKATYGLDYRLRFFRERMATELFNISAAESAASTPAEARERVAAKRQARR